MSKQALEELYRVRYGSKEDCPYCTKLQDWCDNVQPEGIQFNCTKPKGHTDVHVACGVNSHMLAVWSN